MRQVTRRHCTDCGGSKSQVGELTRNLGLCITCAAVRVVKNILGAQELPPGYCMANGQMTTADLKEAIEKGRLLYFG